MLDYIKALFQSSESPMDEADPADVEAEIRLAACALLIELAYADEEFTDDERIHLVASIRRQWALDPKEAQELIEVAERQRDNAVDLWQFTTLIKRHYSVGQKMVLAETMWGLAYSDGELSNREEYLMRKICGLLDLKPGYLSAARKRVEGDDPPGRAPRID